uniref:Uncharacterized protein n=1 Tax=Anguilla anguilla TaxID=7936 RepID=A0A0E9X9R7_ANGAN
MGTGPCRPRLRNLGNRNILLTSFKQREKGTCSESSGMKLEDNGKSAFVEKVACKNYFFKCNVFCNLFRNYGK